MTLHIPAERMLDVGLSEHDALVEFSCWLFDRQTLELWPAAQLAGLSRVEFEAELERRKIPIYRPTLDDLAVDIETLRQMDSRS